MQLVINITKKVYDRYRKAGRIKMCDIDIFEKALNNCVVLPKEHGRLIDADDIDNHIVGHVDTRSCPTIIEADKTESEDKE